LHTGEALPDAGKFFGRTVILASRIAGQAADGQILVSSILKELTRSAGDLRFGEARSVRLKGVAQPQDLSLVDWQPAEEANSS
jgi:class 3 adenylate cyclase